ncbi:hypothetical protein AX769_16720 [Frondihabitans sp. PAMC 28766]|uniref:TetR/AcrR family transcriptional regulator n=1 Tax=Frondihabitans sp. PAMC 28766 TaxID=1795630 RepID=UPI00078E5AEE|nr:TetR family transcriptional regulator [Frondihabitans sp. PAMC 28766]AMM21477.1 hypothetical protein AX769_16720 [Frondihabitans sp. PAMC 28766]
MPRRYDSAATARLVLDAAAIEFAASGIDGARVDKIAARAGVNKTAIYSYYGNKESLFAAALQDRLGQLAESVALTPEDVPGYAGALFDFVTSHPDIVRLYEHEGMHFEPAAAPGFDDREQYHQRRVAVIREATGPGSDAESIFLSLISMAYWFVAAPQVVRMIYGTLDEAQVKERYRARVVETARILIAGTGAGSGS